MNRQLAELDVSKMLYNPRARDFAQTIEKDIPEFKSFKGRVTHKQFAVYVVLMYDLYSPLWREEPDYYQRMYEAARMAGFPKGRKDREFTYDAERVLFGQVPSANNAIIAYITQFALPEYFQLIGYTSLLSSETRKIISGKGGHQSPKILEETGKKIRELQKFLFNTGSDDITKEMQQALYSRLEKDKLRMRPEEIIKQMADEGKLPADFSPYEEEDLPDQEESIREAIRFSGDE